ncbi:MAG TPA: hypothetical protein VM165_01525 [Planctomycetaceae bacterium]|nr:hypothetical protein [Planctomycetaceae bacterium]
MSTAPQKPAATTKRPRSPGEKLVVWGGIVVLLLLVAVQAHARFGYEMSLKKLQARVAADDNGSIEGSPLYLSEVPTFLVGWPSRKVEEERHWHAVTYSWQGLGKSYSIRMPYDTSEAKPVVLSLETNDAPPEPKPEMVAAADDAHSGAAPPSVTSMAGMGGPGGGGPGGGGPRPDIMESDKDGDGKVSKEEAPEQMAQFFDRMDANSDGFIDADEAEAARQRRAARQAAGGGPGGGGAPGAHSGPPGSGRRPQAEGDAPAETPVDAEGAVKAVATEAADAKPADEKPAP